MTRGTCSVCGAGIYSGASVCAQCRSVKTGHHRHLHIRSFMDVLMYPVALIIVAGLFALGCWLVSLLEHL